MCRHRYTCFAHASHGPMAFRSFSYHPLQYKSARGRCVRTICMSSGCGATQGLCHVRTQHSSPPSHAPPMILCPQSTSKASDVNPRWQHLVAHSLESQSVSHHPPHSPVRHFGDLRVMGEWGAWSLLALQSPPHATDQPPMRHFRNHGAMGTWGHGAPLALQSPSRATHTSRPRTSALPRRCFTHAIHF